MFFFSAIQTLQKLQEALQTQRQKQQQKIALHIQQWRIAQQTNASSTQSQTIVRSSAAQINANSSSAAALGSAQSVVSSLAMTSLTPSSAGMAPPLSSPVLAGLSPALLAQAHSLAASSSAAQLVTSSAAYHSSSSTPIAAPNNSHVAVMQSPQQQTRADVVANTSSTQRTHQPLQVLVTENGESGAHSPESAGTPLGSPELNIPVDSVLVSADGDKQAAVATAHERSVRYSLFQHHHRCCGVCIVVVM